MNTFHKISISTLSLPVFWLVFVFGQLPLVEGYNAIQPDIDTRFSDGFSDKAFKKLMVGDDTMVVLKILGQPLRKEKFTKSSQQWCFASDGSCEWADFAWLKRDLVIEDGKIARIDFAVCYD